MNKWQKRGIAVLIGVAMGFVFSALGWAEFDVKVGDVYEHQDGTMAIVTFVSTDKTQINTNSKLYETRKESERIYREWKMREREVKALEEIAQKIGR